MKQGDTLFVYGTLRPGERADLSTNRRLQYLGQDKINGLLYHLGWYPGAVFEPGHFDPTQPIIVGDLFRIRDVEIVPILDAYEGYPDLYGRGQTFTANGRKVWTYFYRRDVSHLEPLRIGDWCIGKNATIAADTPKEMVA